MRFLVNLPAEEFESFERLFFAVESAHWFYDDFYRERHPSLPRLQLKSFAAKFFDHTALLQEYAEDVDKLTKQFMSYKQEVPTCGAALLNSAMDKVVLVRGWGSGARWGFPKGKLAKNETELECAIREVYEETGFDMTPSVTEDDTHYIDSFSSGRYCRIFIVPDVPESTVFETRTRKEISAIRWVPISVLPDSLKLVKQQNKEAIESPHAGKKMLFAQNGVVPFTKRIKAWISRRRNEVKNGLCPTVRNLDDVLTAEEVEAMLSTSPENDRREQRASDHHIISVIDVEANLPSSSRETPVRRKGGKSKTRAAASGSNGKPSNKRSRKETSQHEALRNQATFGVTGGSSMSDSERDRLFRQYVLETDRIANANGLRDEFWPVPLLTSKDFTEQEVQEAEAARGAVSLGERSSASARADAPRGSAKQIIKQRNEERVVKLGKQTLVCPIEEPFRFDLEAVMASMTFNPI